MLDLETRDRLVKELSALSELELQSVVDELRPHIEKNNLSHLWNGFTSSEKEDLEDTISDLKSDLAKAEEKLEDIRNIL